MASSGSKSTQMSLLPTGRNPKCTDCELHRGSKTVCIYGENVRQCDVMIVLETPNNADVRAGKPGQGQSGAILRSLLDEVGLDDVYITNVVKCQPPKNRSPNKDELKACRQYLDDEIDRVKPKFVLALGSTAAKAVLKISKITMDHGKILENPKWSFKGMAAFSPAYAMRDPSKLEPLKRDLQRFAQIVKGTFDDELPKVRIIRTPDDMDDFFQASKQADRFSFDTETTGLFPHNPDEGRVRCLGIGFPGSVWVFPLNVLGTPFLTYASQSRLVRWLVQALHGKMSIAQNGKFDNQWLARKYGVYFHLNFDTGLAHHVLDENSPHGLKEMARTYLGAPDYDLPLKEKIGPDDQINLEALYTYCGYDCFYTLKLADMFDSQLKRSKQLRKLFYRLVMPAARAFTHIEMNGLTVDLEKFAENESTLRRQVSTLETELNKLAKKELNWNSPQQVAKLLYEDLGLKATVFTDSDPPKPSTGEEALYNLKDQHPIAAKLVEYREATKFLGTYFEGWREYMVKDQVFFSTKLHGTVTGRYSSRLHQTPRDGRIRNCVIAPEGWTFVQGDLSQAELRIAAIVSRDVELITCFRRRIDVHWRTLLFTIEVGGGEYVPHVFATAAALGLKTKDLAEACAKLLKVGHEKCIAIWKGWKEGRKKAKGINFGFIYGMREKKFIEYAKLKYGFEPTLEEAEVLRGAYFDLYRQLNDWHDRQRKIVKLEGQVINLAGRIRRLPGIHSSDRSLSSECERQAINSPIQGFIGDLKAMSLIEIFETMPPYYVKVLGEVHDSVLMIVRTSALDEYLPKIAQIMRAPKLLKEFGLDKLPVPIEADLELGPWGAGKAYVLPPVTG